jgi:hypothetical protein
MKTQIKELDHVVINVANDMFVTSEQDNDGIEYIMCRTTIPNSDTITTKDIYRATIYLDLSEAKKIHDEYQRIFYDNIIETLQK